MIKSAIILLFFVLFPIVVFSQCNSKNNSFQTGEKIVYKAVYNWGFIWVDAGEVVFEVLNGKYNNTDVYHLKSTGISYSKYDWFFKVRDYYDAYIDKTDLRPYKYVRNTNDGGFKVYNRYYFNYDKKKVYTFSENSDKPLEKDTFNLTPCLLDLITATYYIRCYDFSQFKNNQKLPLNLIVDNETINLYIRYIGKETIEHPETEKKYKCLKFKAMLMEGTIFSGGEDVTVWITDDANKIPVLIEAKILIGSVKAILTSAKGLRH